MRDFCNVPERDSIRLIIAQDLKENGIDLDSQHNQQQIHNQQQQSQIQQKISQKDKDSIINKSNISTSHDPDHDGNARVFGLPLKSLEMVQVKLNDQLLNVPVILKCAIDHISQYMHVEGIFRRNGTTTRLKELKKQVEEGQYNFAQFSINDVTSLVKLFFRELPESLLTFQLYNYFIQAIKLIDANKSKYTILNLCLQLPDINLNVLIYLMQFLKQICTHEQENKMNSFNLAVCFAPNIIYTRINKINELYINEERMIIQFLIENSILIGKISDSVYERSLMLNSLCCSSDMKDYDCEQESFSTARSTSLSSYCNNKKEKKKRRSSSLKELMTTIQNSISKFRRRSASEKNDKTTCSIMTCTSTDTSTRILNDETSKTGSTTTASYKLLTPISTNIYTPRIKRNAEDSLQSTTKNALRKLLEKLPQRNLLLPNAPMTPFSTAKKNKHPFKLLGSEKPFKFENLFSPNIRFTENKEAAKFTTSNGVNNNTLTNAINQTPAIALVSSSISCAPISCTPAPAQLNAATHALTATPLNVVNLQKQLKYDDSPSAVLFAAASTSINPIYDSASLKSKSMHSNDKNHTIANGELLDCRRRLEMSNVDSTKHSYNHGHYHHHHHHHYHSHHHNTNSNRFINQSDICPSSSSAAVSQCSGDSCNRLSSCSSNACSAAASTSYTADYHQRTLTDSIRCTLKRGRPNTPKTGLSVEYRNRKSVTTTPEIPKETTQTAPTQPIIHSTTNSSSNTNKTGTNTHNDDNLNTAIIQIDDDCDIMNNPIYSNLDDLNDARLDDGILGDDDDELEDNEDDCNETTAEQEKKNEESKICCSVDDDENDDDNKSQVKFHLGSPVSNYKLNKDDVGSQLEVDKCRDQQIIVETNTNNENNDDDDGGGDNNENISTIEEFKLEQKSINEISLADSQSNEHDDMLNSLLRRQSLFKLREKMSGRVSKTISDIEKRKLSPYRFCNSPLKRATNLSKVSPLRVPSIFCKKLLKTPLMQEQFTIKKMPGSATPKIITGTPGASKTLTSNLVEAKLPTDSGLLSKAANDFGKKKLIRNKSVKRLNQSPSQTQLSRSLNGSPTSKGLIKSSQFNLASESFDF